MASTPPGLVRFQLSVENHENSPFYGKVVVLFGIAPHRPA